MALRVFELGIIACLIALPASAQNVDFGDDSGQWARDGECDDMRFEGAGMTNTPLVQADILADATDCRAAYDAGTIAFVGDLVQPKGGKVAATPPQIIDGINFGNNASEFANDGECDDRRFYGSGMALALTWRHLGADANDCAGLYNDGLIFLWDLRASVASTQCVSIDFGDDSGEYPEDGECDDMRFEGLGATLIMNENNIGRDASDCARACVFGTIGWRDYDPVPQ